MVSGNRGVGGKVCVCVLCCVCVKPSPLLAFRLKSLNVGWLVWLNPFNTELSPRR